MAHLGSDSAKHLGSLVLIEDLRRMGKLSHELFKHAARIIEASQALTERRQGLRWKQIMWRCTHGFLQQRFDPFEIICLLHQRGLRAQHASQAVWQITSTVLLF
jgi:hypothetical protein